MIDNLNEKVNVEGVVRNYLKMMFWIKRKKKEQEKEENVEGILNSKSGTRTRTRLEKVDHISAATFLSLSSLKMDTADSTRAFVKNVKRVIVKVSTLSSQFLCLVA